MKKLSSNPQVEIEKAVVDDPELLKHNQDSNNSEELETDTQKQSFIEAMNMPQKKFIVIIIIAVLAGVGTGFGTFRLSAKSSTSSTEQIAVQPTEGGIKNGDEFGISDVGDAANAVGYLEEGGLEGEGSHKLLRPGGDSQTVYLTSSTTDLDEFVGMDVEIWGETFKGQKAGWFMDVIKVKIIEVEATPPTEE